MTASSSDCRAPEGVMVGLIDGMIAMARIVAKGPRDEGVMEALADFFEDEDVQQMLTEGLARQAWKERQ